jgi:hypothetical protein
MVQVIGLDRVYGFEDPKFNVVYGWIFLNLLYLNENENACIFFGKFKVVHNFLIFSSIPK